MKIDAHQHFWKYSAFEYPWIDKNMKILMRDYLPPHLRSLLSVNDIDGTIVIQARQNLDETRWLLKLAQEYFFIKGVVGWIDLTSDQVEAELKEFTTNPKLVGVRHVLQDEPDDYFMLQDNFLRGIQKLRTSDLAYDILIFPRHLPIALELVSRFPEQRFVLDHIGKPFIRQGDKYQWESELKQLASCSNVYCKISGLVTEADWLRWTYYDLQPFLDTVFESFGVERIMFGSDWPVCTLAASYRQIIGIVKRYVSDAGLSKSEKEAIWGLNAERFYLKARNN
jgi:L-fucono-1,5-lactonase